MPYARIEGNQVAEIFSKIPDFVRKDPKQRKMNLINFNTSDGVQIGWRYVDGVFSSDLSGVRLSIGDTIKARMEKTDAIVLRHIEEREAGLATTLTHDQFIQVVQTRGALRSAETVDDLPPPLSFLR